MLLDKAIRLIHLSATRRTAEQAPKVDHRIRLVVVIGFIVVVTSMPIDDPGRLLWLFCFPIITAESYGIGYGRLFIRSLWVLPLVAFIGIFNPIFDREIVWSIGSINIDRGWLTLLSLVLRGLLAFQALLLLINGCGFFDICRCLRFFRLPAVLVTQLLMLYRYIAVLLAEALDMHRARQARGFGRKSYPLSMWGVFAGQLLLRSMARARRVNAAMTARGFNGVYYFRPFDSAPTTADYLYLAAWMAVFLLVRFVNLSAIVSHFLAR